MAQTRATQLTLRREYYDVFSQTQLQEELETLAPGLCIIDLSNVEYIDSTSLGVLIRRLKQLREVEPTTYFRLVRVRDSVAKIFALTSLDSIFGIQQGDWEDV